MATLQTQYKNYLKDNPKSDLTFSEWQIQILVKPIKPLIMEKEFVSYHLALRLKELGFNEPCMASYVKDTKEFTTRLLADFYKEQQISTPTYRSAFKWFRDNYKLIGAVCQGSVDSNSTSDFEYMIDKLNTLNGLNFIQEVSFKTYEEAELACLEKLIEIVEEK